MKPLVMLAYSGGLDTSAIVPWLRETRDADVLCFAADVGQGAGELDGLREKALRSGARDSVIADLREKLCAKYEASETLKSEFICAEDYAAYELHSATARPLVRGWKAGFDAAAAEQAIVAAESRRNVRKAAARRAAGRLRVAH